jgi:phosphatidylglycerol lysyltransferase
MLRAIRTVPVSRRLAAAAVATAAMGLVIAALLHFARGLDLGAVGIALAALPPERVALSLGLTVASYALLSGYDRLALASLGQTAPWPVIARASFTSYTLSHNLGFGLLTGGSARLAIYGRAGIAPATVARVVVIASVAFWCGVGLVSALSLLVHAHALRLFGITLSPLAAQVAGAATLALFAAVPFAARSPALGARAGMLSAPDQSPAIWTALLGVSCLDLALGVLALLVLVPSLGAGDFPQLFLAYVLAIVMGQVSQVPGGLGVFEGTLLAALGIHDPRMAAGLIAYRAIYYLIPLGLSLALNGAIALGDLFTRQSPARRALDAVVMEAAPALMAMMVFGGGLVLLLSGILPGVHDRLQILRALMPLPLVEAAHLAATLAGVGLLLVAPALLSRSRSGLGAALVLLLSAAVFSIGKGVDFEEAGLMLAMAAILRLCRPAFYRETMGAFSPHNRPWLVAAVIAVIGAAVLGQDSYPHLTVTSRAWFHFGWRADGARYLRASFASCVMVAGFAVRELLSRPPVRAGLAALPPEVFARATAHSGRSDAMLAHTGDKRFLVAPDGDAFLMFAPQGRTWFVMGDPVGNPAEWTELVWELRRQSDRVGSRLCFYQVSDAFLPLALELGLRPVKYGEEGIIDPATFTLAGARMKGLRNSVARARRDGLSLQVLAVNEVAAHLPVVQAISAAWLRRHGGREKRFSLGAFDPAYLTCCGMALVQGPGHDGKPGAGIAFANIWRSGDGAELSVDLMRQSADAPPGTMDFLLTELIGHAREQGCARFNIGVAPLSGMRGGRLATRWTRAAHVAFGFRRLRYDFKGLRRYKDKFAPTWHNRYIALPPGMAGYRALIQLLRLIGQ